MTLDEKLRLCATEIESSLLIFVPAATSQQHTAEDADFYSKEVPLALKDVKDAVSTLLEIADALAKQRATTTPKTSEAG